MPETILITGAGSGIGLACALQVARAGYHTIAGVLDTTQDAEVQEAARRAGLVVSTVCCDVTDAAAVRRVVETAGPLYGLVNSAGIGLRGFFEDLSDDEIRQAYEVNMFGSMSMARAVLPGMRARRRGRIILVSSAGGRIASMGISGYSSGKFALEGFAEALAMEVLPFGIGVSLIEPGLVLTPHFTHHRGRARAATDPHSPYYRWFVQHEHLVDEILLKQRIAPEDVAAAVLAALRARRPRLHYVVGRYARLTVALRRHLPDAWFERLYFRTLLGRVTQPRHPVRELRNLAPASDPASGEKAGSPPVFPA